MTAVTDQERAEIERAVDAFLDGYPASRFSIAGTVKPAEVRQPVRDKLVRTIVAIVAHLSDSEPEDQPCLPFDLPLGPTADAVLDVLTERLRQISVEGFTPEADHEHRPGALASAAAVYLMPPDERLLWGTGAPVQWPFDEGTYKPATDRRRDLVRGAALAIAELERYDATEGRA